MSAPRTVSIALTTQQAKWLGSEMSLASASPDFRSRQNAWDILRQLGEQVKPGSIRQALVFRAARGEKP